MMDGLRGVLPVVPTPFAGGVFDPASFQRMLDRMLDHVDGYTLLGSTGEAPSMPVAERMAIAEAALAMTPPEKKVVVGVTSTSIADTVALARHAASHKACAVLCAAPFYFENTPAGVFDFLQELDDAIGIDLVLYDNPLATKTTLAARDVVEWVAELKHLSTVKLTDHEMEKVKIWQDAGINVIGGDDAVLFEYLAAGVDGAMVIAPVVFPAAFREVWERVNRGETLPALDVFAREIAPFVHVFGIGREIAMTKALLEEIGVFGSGEVRAPLRGVDPQRRAILRRAVELGNAATDARVTACRTEAS